MSQGASIGAVLKTLCHICSREAGPTEENEKEEDEGVSAQYSRRKCEALLDGRSGVIPRCVLAPKPRGQLCVVHEWFPVGGISVGSL